MSQTPPVGTVTLFFSDIEGSTSAWERFGDAYAPALQAHYELLTRAFQEHRGFPIRTEGDSFFAAFDQASDAVRCAAAVQQRLAAYPWPPEIGPIRVRIGLHTGEPRFQDGDYYGPPVNRAARIQAAAHGGQVLLSAATYQLVAEEMGEELKVRCLGRHRLKDLSEPETLFELQYPGAPADLPPPRTLEFRPNNLPLVLSRFIGREREAAEAKRLLESRRLLTLTGPGGCGKTRLALQVAADVLPEYPDGVWLVELAQLSDPALVPQAVATALRVREEPGRSVMATLCEALRARHLLLILDNCEHLVEACSALAGALLRACPGLRILATSREILNITGETAWRVPSLSLPEPEQLSQQPEALPHEVARYEAVQLFIDRALLCQPTFAVTRENALAVAQVCRRLDGIPLAIELAAARVRVLSVEQIAARLDDRFRLLGAPQRGALPHQQTLRAAMDWSYDLLSEAERLLLQRLSVFAGGFTLEAAEYVCSDSEAEIGEGADPSAVGRLHARQGGHPHCAVEQKEVLDLLTQLVNKSLVLVDESETGGETRYRLLETIRQYGAEKMAGSGEGARLQARHADWFCCLAERAERELRGPVQGEWLRRLEIDHDNLRAALRWAVETEEEAVPEKRQTALRLGAALARFWEIRGYWSEGREQLRRLLALPWDPQTASRELGLVRARVLHGAGILAFYQGDYTDARALLEECLSSPAAAGERRARAAALNSLGIVALSQGDFATAQAKYEESLAIRRDLNDREGIASTLNNLGMVAQYQSDFAMARAKYEESLAIRRTLGDLTDIAASLNNLGNVAFLEGDFEAAAALYEESLALKRKLGDRPGIAGTLDNLGLVAQCRGDAATARRLHEKSLTLRRELGDRPGIAQSLHGLGGVARFLGETSEARRCYEESLALARALGDRQILAAVLCSLARVSADAGLPDGLDPRALYEESLAIRRALGDRPGMVECLEGLAAFFGDRNDPERAARLLAAAAAARGALGAPRLPMEQAEHERDVARIRAALGEAAFAKAWARGEALTLEEAIAETIGKPAAA